MYSYYCCFKTYRYRFSNSSKGSNWCILRRRGTRNKQQTLTLIFKSSHDVHVVSNRIATLISPKPVIITRVGVKGIKIGKCRKWCILPSWNIRQQSESIFQNIVLREQVTYLYHSSYFNNLNSRQIKYICSHFTGFSMLLADLNQ